MYFVLKTKVLLKNLSNLTISKSDLLLSLPVNFKATELGKLFIREDKLNSINKKRSSNSILKFICNYSENYTAISWSSCIDFSQIINLTDVPSSHIIFNKKKTVHLPDGNVYVNYMDGSLR